jgi:Ca2+-binding EF-hand superfamily protein
MKKLLPVALMLSLLSGCGANHLVNGTSARSGYVSAQSKAGVEKGIRGMFHAAFKAADADHDNKLSPQEIPANLPTAVGAGAAPTALVDPAAEDQARKELFAKLDLNKDGFVTYREFARPDAVQAAIVFYRSEVAKAFASLDKNGDHYLSANEVEGSAFKFADLDLNKNGKVTLSEFEDAFVRVLGGGPDPVEPVTPAPAPAGNAPAPAPAGNTPAPAPAGDAPAPAPAGDTPAPAPVAAG